MFIGHFAIGFGAKRYAPDVSLGFLFLACQLADLIWPNLVLLGIESFSIEPGITAITPLNFTSYPYSHSLLAQGLWGGLLGGLYALFRRLGTRVAVVIAIVVVSHWALDVLAHRPDMPLSLSATPLLGLGLWNHPLVAVPTELLLFAAGIWLYVQQSAPVDRIGKIGFWALVSFLLLIYIANLLGPPPPSVAAVAWSAQAMWLIVFWGFWVDRHREKRTWRKAASRDQPLHPVPKNSGTVSPKKTHG
jgi:hypothetical protein